MTTEPFWTGPGYRGEYQCPHGVGHGNHIHGCDGCCSRDDFPLNEANTQETEERETVEFMKRHPDSCPPRLKLDCNSPETEKPPVKKSDQKPKGGPTKMRKEAMEILDLQALIDVEKDLDKAIVRLSKAGPGDYRQVSKIANLWARRTQLDRNLKEEKYDEQAECKDEASSDETTASCGPPNNEG